MELQQGQSQGQLQDSPGLKRSTESSAEEPPAKVQSTATSSEEPPAKVQTTLESSLLCSVCKEFPRKPPIQTCMNGHYTCIACRQKLAQPLSCPSCRSTNIDCRNIILEEVLATLQDSGKLYPCKHKDSGCTFSSRIEELEHHEDSCPFKIVACPGRRFKNCTFTGTKASLVQHIQYQKCATLVLPHSYPHYSIGVVDQNIDLFAARGIHWRPLAFIEEGHVFAYIQISRSNGEFTITPFTYEDDHTNKNTVVKIKVQSKPVPTQSEKVSSIKDYLVNPENRPSIELIHHNGVRIHVPRPGFISMVVSGQEEQDNGRPRDKLGYCQISVGSVLKVDTTSEDMEGLDCFTYKGKMVRDDDATTDHGNSLILKDSQVKKLMNHPVVFYYSVEFGVSSVHLTTTTTNGTSGQEGTEPLKDDTMGQQNASDQQSTTTSGPSGSPVLPGQILTTRCIIPFRSTRDVSRTLVNGNQGEQVSGNAGVDQPDEDDVPLCTIIPIAKTKVGTGKGLLEEARRSYGSIFTASVHTDK
jgi:hypothetical protein